MVFKKKWNPLKVEVGVLKMYDILVIVLRREITMTKLNLSVE